MLPYALAFGTMAITAAGQVVMRWRALEHGGAPDRWRYLLSMYTDPWVLGCLVSAVLASLLYAMALQRLPVSVAYPIMALSFVAVPLAGRWLFGDGLVPAQWLGMALIVAGVVLVSGR